MVTERDPGTSGTKISQVVSPGGPVRGVRTVGVNVDTPETKSPVTGVRFLTVS